jgi:hypothetical protein
MKYRTKSQSGETLPSRSRDPIPGLISLVVRVRTTGGLEVCYDLPSGETPQQRPVMFANREQLANQFRELGLAYEAALITLADTETKFVFNVVGTREIIKLFDPNNPPTTAN